MPPIHSLSRRQMLSATAAAAATVSIVPRHVLGGEGHNPPSNRLNVAGIGLGGMGSGDIRSVPTENVVALCDVDQHALDRNAKQFPGAKLHTDFRKMLDTQKDIDAVMIATPDHVHAVATMTALKHGKHVHCQKPLTHSVYEARAIAKAAKEAKVATQMGNQGQASVEARLLCETVWSGAIGTVCEVHGGSNRYPPISPRGIRRPSETPAVPANLNWDLWLGPAPQRPYHPTYHPFAWRGWWDFGTGAVGDMGAHLIDQPFWALKLHHPLTIQASSSVFTKDSYPVSEVITYEFGARGTMPPVKMVWYDGGLMPPRPASLPDGRMMGDDGGGVLFVGTKGHIMCSTYGANPRILPESLMQEYKRPEKTIPRSPGIMEEWIAAIKAGKKSTTDFEYSGALTETMLLGNVALRMKNARMALKWDNDKFEITNLPEANKWLHKDYRQGWSL